MRLRSPVPLRLLVLAALLPASACDAFNGSQTKNPGEIGQGGDGDDDPIDGDGDSGGTGAALSGAVWLELDQPAFYDADASVEVTGTVHYDGDDWRPGDAMQSLTADGVTVPVEEDGRFSFTVDLGSAPFVVTRVEATDLDDGQHVAEAQVGLAVPGDGVAPGGQRTEIGPTGADELADLIGRFATQADFEPPPGFVLGTDTCDPCPVGLECGLVTETIRADGTATVSLRGQLDTASGQLDLDLQQTALTWGVEVVNTGWEERTFSTTLTAAIGPASGSSPALSCAGLGLAQSIQDAGRAWSFADPVSCADPQELGESSGLWVAFGQPGLDNAACAWGSWLDDAVASEVSGAALSYDADADADGIHLPWEATASGGTPPWQAPERASPLSPLGIDVALADQLLGITLDLAARSAGATTHSADGHTLSASGPHGDSAVLAAASATGGQALALPLAYAIADASGASCEAGHLVPHIVDVTLTPSGGAATLTLEGPAGVGSTTSARCPDLSAADRATLFSEAVEASLAGVEVQWSTAEGLVADQGASMSWGSAAAAFTVAVSL